MLQQNWATEIFFVNDLANKTEKFHDKNCHTSKNSVDVPVSKETQLKSPVNLETKINNPTSRQNWAIEIFYVNDLANKTEKFHSKNCLMSKNVPVPYETQLFACSEIWQYRQKLNEIANLISIEERLVLHRFAYLRTMLLNLNIFF